MYDWDSLRVVQDAAAFDARVDARADVRDAAPDTRDVTAPDVAPDVSVDVTPDLPADVGTDVAMDVALDAAVDVGADVAMDVALDVRDASTDVRDASVEAAMDVAPDAPVDVAPDLPVDNAPACPSGMMCPCSATNAMGYCRPGASCAGGACVQGATAGALVVTEIMNDPLADDLVGEWFEVHNPGATPLDLRGVRLTSANDMPHTVAGDAPIVVPPRGYFVFGRSAAQSMNGMVPVGYAYGSAIAFNNGGADSIVLDLGTAATEIDRVAFDSAAGMGWPRMPSRAKSLRPDMINHVANDNRMNWCDAPTQWVPMVMAWGSPGVVNPACP